MPVRKLKEFLDRERVKYVSIVHSTAYTAQEVAASAHITGKELAKTVIVELDGKMAMAVLPANRNTLGFWLELIVARTALESRPRSSAWIMA